MVNILAFLGPKTIFLIVFVVVLLLLMILLIVINKKLKRKVMQKEKIEEKESAIITEIKNLKTSTKKTELILESLSSIAKELLTGIFNTDKNADYYELAEFFKQKKKNKISSFCQNIEEALYSGRKIEKKEINSLIHSFEEIISEEDPLIRELKEEFKQKKLQKQKAEEEKRPQKPSQIKIQPDAPEIIAPINLKILEDKKISSLEMFSKLKKLDDEQIADAYKQLQFLYKQTYEKAERNKDKNSLLKLQEFRKIMIEKINEYINGSSKASDFAQTISAGVKLMRSIAQR